MRPQSFPELVRRGFYESCEDRLALTANPLADFILDEPSMHGVLGDDIVHHQEVAPNLASAHASSGLNHVRNNYGFTGGGQTVVVIDSGIAYNHQSLGEGFGEGYRVVGGWDFAENDADPYDDGPAGFHGTHVAGIVGSDHATHTGVAPDVDLVALRVFNDQGAGSFGWVEQALQWVHAHRNDFENPITTVNLSLGTSWNADYTPGGAILENEFAQLKADGIFISVSAGNDFQEFNQQPGLSYPAASPYVVPVASVNDSGVLSSFSQRNERVLAAPGQAVTSTVPDYIFGADGVYNDYASASGTSMAAPYVAGASVLLREAMQFVGYTNITQDTLYDHLYDTADVIYDSITGLDIHRINLQTAFDALMPADEDAGQACSLGEVGEGFNREGLIGRLDDIDTFTFTAAQSGQATFSLGSGATHWQAGTGQSVSGGDLQFQVVAGETYTVTLAGEGALSHYDFGVTIASTAIDLGAVDFDSFADLAVSGEATYLLTSTSGGFLSVLAARDTGGESVQLELYDEQNVLLASTSFTTGSTQIDALVGAGESVYLRIVGTAQLDLTAANLVSQSGQSVTVLGTSGDDSVTLTAGATHQVAVNGFAYGFAAQDVTQIVVNGSAGADSLVVNGSANVDTVSVSLGSIAVNSAGYQFLGSGFENMAVNGGGGNDVATLYDTAGDDTLVATNTYAQLTGTGYSHRLNNFSRVNTYASSGHDLAYLYDSAGDDVLAGQYDHSLLYGSGYYNYARGFDRVNAYATTGTDLAVLYDSAGDDIFGRLHDHSFLYGTGFYNYARGFDRVNGYATNGGYDLAIFHDSAGDDVFVGLHDHSAIITDGTYNYARGFERVDAYAINGGNDLAMLYDSAGDDIFGGLSDHSFLYGTGFYNYVRGFERVNAYATSGGYDQALFYDSAGDDIFGGLHDHSFLYGTGFYNYARGFERVNAYASNGGNDLAIFYASQHVDTFVGTNSSNAQYGTGYYNYARGFASTRVSADANDRAYFFDLGASDSANGSNDILNLHRGGSTLKYQGIGRLDFYSQSGFDMDILAVDYIYQNHLQ